MTSTASINNSIDLVTNNTHVQRRPHEAARAAEIRRGCIPKVHCTEIAGTCCTAFAITASRTAELPYYLGDRQDRLYWHVIGQFTYLRSYPGETQPGVI